MPARSSISYVPKRRRRRAPIICIGGDKGGTGKSFGGRTVAGWLRQHGHDLFGIDGDPRNGHLARYYESSMQVVRSKLRDADQWTLMFKAWKDVADDQVILIDFPGNIGDEVESEAVRLKLAAEQLDREIINIWVASEEEDSIWLLESALKVADASRTIFWMNGRFAADPSKFVLWNDSNTRQQFIAEGGTEAFLPVLPIYPRTRIARERCPFDDVSAAKLDYIEQIDFDLWWARVDQELEPLAAMLECLS